jgi:hypothetical protein
MCHRFTQRQVTNFWKKVDRRDADECWLWNGCRLQAGRYGYVHWSQGWLYAHRVSWEMENGPIPPDTQICHRCDTPMCVNPNHLFLGSPADNAADRDAKGRGSRQGRGKLCADHVRIIRSRYAAGGITIRQLADEYGIAWDNMRLLLAHRTWKTV